jgi:hypothetical protein
MENAREGSKKNIEKVQVTIYLLLNSLTANYLRYVKK